MTVIDPQVITMTVIDPPIAAKPIVTPIVEAPYGSEVHSVRFLQGTVAHAEPRSDAERLGVVRKDTLAGVASAVPAGSGCSKRWIQIVPRGWVCESVLAPSRDQPTAAAAPVLTDDDKDPGPVVHGVYGFVRGDNVQAFANASDADVGERGRKLVGPTSVRASGSVNVNGKRYWQTSQGDLIDESAIVRIAPSRFKGVVIDKTAQLPAWVRSHRNSRDPIKTRDAANGKIIGELPPRTVVTIVEESADGRFVRISDRAWIERADLRAAAITAPPPGTAPNEKWFDIDLDEQVLVAYEGTHPVYATLVSTGKWDHPTPPSISRVSSKLQTAHMVNEKAGERYSVADVPWTMYYDNNFALHTSYWHDGFGGVRSHGCVNLAPRDARVLYQWSSPDVPPGWVAVYGGESHPGSLVRARSRKVPEPAWRGYARTLHERSVMTSVASN